MKMLFINPPIREWSKPNIVPLGLGYLAAVLRNAGHDVEIMDINAYRWNQDEVREKIKDANFDVVGIGAIVTVYKYVKWLIGVLKKYHPRKKVIIGGSVEASVPHIILEKTGADIVCTAEGEGMIIGLIEAIEGKRQLEDIDGIWFKDGQGKIVRNRASATVTDLDTIPFPAWDLFPMDIYVKNPVGAPNRNKWIDGDVSDSTVFSMNISATRGCPYQCIYCYHDFMGLRYRIRSPQNILAEIEALHERYGVKYIQFMDDEFCLKQEFVYDFCRKMKELFGGRITWGCTGRVNLMTEKLIETMKDAGCVLIGYGVESGSQKILDIMKKNVTVAQAKEAIRLTKKHLGWADCSFMIGTPGETKETIQETVDFCKELDLIPEVIFFTTPYPGTELYSLALSEGKIRDEEEYILTLGEQGEKVRVNFTGFSDEELLRIQEDMISQLNAWNKVKHPESR